MTNILINIPRETVLYPAVKSAILSENMLQQAVNRFRDGYGERLTNNLVFDNENGAPFRFTTAGLTFDEISMLVPNRYKSPLDVPLVVGLTWADLDQRPMVYDLAYAYNRQQRDYARLYDLLGQPKSPVSFETHDDGSVDLVVDEADADILRLALTNTL